MSRLSKKSFTSAICFIFFLLISAQTGFSQTYTSPLTSDGGVDTHLYKSDTILFETSVLEDGSFKVHDRTLDAGLSMLHSAYLSMLYVPLRCSISDNFQILFSLPYLTKTLVSDEIHHAKNGYGDLMTGLTCQLRPFNILSLATTARIAFPTGNANARDENCYIPMGYGGYTSSIQETISTKSFDTGIITIRLFISGAYIYYFKSKHETDETSKLTFDKNYAWTAMGGIELGITDNLAIQIKGNYINLEEMRYKYDESISKWEEADDSIKQVNILPFIKYRFPDDISGQAGAIYSVKTVQDSDLAVSYDPHWKLVLGIQKRFSDSNSTEQSVNNNSSDNSINNETEKKNIEESNAAGTDYNQNIPVKKKKNKRKKRQRK